MSAPDRTEPAATGGMTRGTSPLEADVLLGNGRTVRVTGLLAVRYRDDPEGVRAFVEDELRRGAPAEPEDPTQNGGRRTA